MGFRLVPKSVTLNDRERHNGRYFALLRNASHIFLTFEPLVKGDNLTNTARLLENGAR